MKKQTPLILVLLIETLLLFLIFLVVFIGVLGIFLPVLPGLVLIGIGAGLYSLLVKANYGRITPRLNKYLVKIKNKIYNLKIANKLMGLIKAIKKRKQKKEKEEILKHGLVLAGFNIALTLAFFFGLIAVSILASLLGLSGLLFFAFIPLLVIFLFAGSSAVIWYRFGQILAGHFKKRKIVNSALVVLVSILPLLTVLLLFSGIINLAGGFTGELAIFMFLGFLLMSILAAVFELLIVSLGVITRVK